MSNASGSGFGSFVPGFEFLQNLAGQAASGVAQGLGHGLPKMPHLGHWVAPTFNVEELEKRIEELKAVHFWLDQNSKALAATIQALEVQKMTLATLQNMNFSLGDVAAALKIKTADDGAADAARSKASFAGLEIPPRTYGGTEVPAPDAPPVPTARKKVARKPARKSPAVSGDPAAGVIDPMQWWGALSQQFQTIANQAVKDMARPGAADAHGQVAAGPAAQAVKTAAGRAAAPPASGRRPPARQAPAKKAAARSSRGR
ncbi:MAG: PhaM family polyhydroxyalkanoate granule multifunctional regulatory protein [Hydrogenophaga sp.]